MKPPRYLLASSRPCHAHNPSGRPTTSTASRLSRGAIIAAAIMLAAAMPGCSSWKRSGAELEAKSEATGRVLKPTFRTAVYRYIDPSTADIFLSDLPLDRLMDPNDELADVSGNIVHFYMFIVPQAGKTPIDATACNITVRHAVYSEGAMGIYAGAGFADIEAPGKSRILGDLLGATLRLAEAGPGFNDPLGPSRMVGSFKADMDEQAALAIGDRLANLAAKLPDLRTPTVKGK